jgi:hypothetical protein
MRQPYCIFLDGRQHFRLLLRPLWAAAIAVVANGCIYTPAEHVEYKSSWIGTDPSCSIRVGLATRDDVLTKLGEPNYATQHDLAWGYLLKAHVGQITGLLGGPCMAVGTAQDDRKDDVWLEFDGRGVLVRCEKLLSAKNGGDDEAAWVAFAKAVPDPIRPEQIHHGTP